MLDIENVIQFIADALGDYREELIDRMREWGEVATGRTADSFRVEVQADGVALVAGGEGTAPVGTLEIGSGPHWVPIASLKEWVKAKGLNVSPWAVQKKIAAVGTDRFASPVQVWSGDVEDVTERIAAEAAARVSEAVTLSVSEIYKPTR